MPITQSRMIALLHAAQDYQDAFEKVKRMIGTTAELVAAKRLPAEVGISQLKDMITDYMLDNPINTMVTIGAEGKNFKPWKVRRNDREAEKARRKRDEAHPFRETRNQGEKLTGLAALEELVRRDTPHQLDTWNQYRTKPGGQPRKEQRESLELVPGPKEKSPELLAAEEMARRLELEEQGLAEEGEEIDGLGFNPLEPTPPQVQAQVQVPVKIKVKGLGLTEEQKKELDVQVERDLKMFEQQEEYERLYGKKGEEE